MECSVCYCNVPNCKLVCGHSFCRDCVKTWYLKGAEATCPMCRKNLYFKRMPIKKWRRDAEEEKKNVIFQEAFDECLEMIVDGDAPSWMVKDELVMMEKTFKYLKSRQDVTGEDIDYVLNETGDYFSDRRLEKTSTHKGDIFAHEKKFWETKKNNRLRS
jgi:Ring finger domain